MPNVIKVACAIALPVLICGCQSSSRLPVIVAVECKPPPAPAAWIMEPREPNLTQRMLNELSGLPESGTKD